MAPHSFSNKSNNDHIKMQRHCLFQTLPPMGKTKLQPLICLEHVTLRQLQQPHVMKVREAEENHHIQKLEAERCKRVEGLGWCLFSF